MKNDANTIAASMDAILQDPDHKKLFSSSTILEKLAFKRTADEEVSTEIEIEFADEMATSLETEASEKSGGVSCDSKKEAIKMGDNLFKSAFDALLQASDDLEEAGFEELSVNALILANSLVVEAKAKKDPKAKEKAEKEKAAKEKAAKEKAKAKAKAEKEKALAKAKAEKEKAATEKAKAKAKAEKEKALAKAKADKKSK